MTILVSAPETSNIPIFIVSPLRARQKPPCPSFCYVRSGNQDLEHGNHNRRGKRNCEPQFQPSPNGRSRRLSCLTRRRDTQNARDNGALTEFTARNPTPRAAKVSKSSSSLAKACQTLHWLGLLLRRSRFRAPAACIADTQVGPRCT